jgi:hypothetical protein
MVRRNVWSHVCASVCIGVRATNVLATAPLTIIGALPPVVVASLIGTPFPPPF